MHDFLTALRNLCLLRAGPQDFLYSPSLLALLVVANVGMDTVLGHWLAVAGVALGVSLATAAVTLGFLYVLLAVRGFGARFVQAGTALAGAALWFSVLAVPAQAVLTPMPTDPALLTRAQALALLYVAALGAWSLAVSAHVLRHALERSFAHGLLLALLMNFSAAIAVQWVLPPAAGA